MAIVIRARRSKYGNQKVKIDGFTFDSKREARRYEELLLMQKAGEIKSLRVHPRFDLTVSGTKVCAYEGDFSYFPRDSSGCFFGGLVVEDVKGVKTAVYRLKKILMRVCKGIEIREIK